jgi:hypothetical protein
MSRGIFGRSERGKTRKAPKRQKSPCSHRRRTFRKLLLIKSSIRLEVWLLSLLGYSGNNDNAMKKYSCANGKSRIKLPPPIGSMFRPKLRTCI